MPADTNRFTSQESYFPVFDVSVKELQALEADVVKHVTAFYTYMKVMRDSLRRLADIKPPDTDGAGDDDWHRASATWCICSSWDWRAARKAIRDLVEFEPTQAEDIVTVLLSELVAYGFLREHFRGDLRQRRLQARDRIIPQRGPRAAQARHGGDGPAMGCGEGPRGGNDAAVRAGAGGHADGTAAQGGPGGKRAGFRDGPGVAFAAYQGGPVAGTGSR